MPEPSRYLEQRGQRGLTHGSVGADAVLDVSSIMEAAGETAFAWDFARDAITWDHHGAKLLGVGQISQIATGLHSKCGLLLNP